MSEKTTPEHGPYLDKFFPDVFKSLNNTSAALKKIYPEVDLPLSIIELVSVRASQINGCASCLSIHMPRARKAGISQEKLDILPSWRETNAFDEQEKAALELTEELTVLPEGRRHADAAVRACRHFAEEQVAALEWAIVMINAYNRISIASGHPPRI